MAVTTAVVTAGVAVAGAAAAAKAQADANKVAKQGQNSALAAGDSNKAQIDVSASQQRVVEARRHSSYSKTVKSVLAARGVSGGSSRALAISALAGALGSQDSVDTEAQRRKWGVDADTSNTVNALQANRKSIFMSGLMGGLQGAAMGASIGSSFSSSGGGGATNTAPEQLKMQKEMM